jgi:hypothetical protein
LILTPLRPNAFFGFAQSLFYFRNSCELTGTVPVSASEKKRGDSMELHFTKAQRRILIGIGIAGYAVFSDLLPRLAQSVVDPTNSERTPVRRTLGLL